MLAAIKISSPQELLRKDLVRKRSFKEVRDRLIRHGLSGEEAVRLILHQSNQEEKRRKPCTGQ